jgi:hypothetical protein
MQNVRCPHCSTELTNDGSLSGQVATCAACGQLFEMPHLVPPPSAYRAPIEPIEPHEGHEPDESAIDDGPRRRKREGNKGFALFTVVALVVLPLVTLIVGLVLIFGSSRGKEKKRSGPVPAQQKNGYRR